MSRRFSKPTLPGLQHLNGNLMCAVDCETTGLIPGKHDIWQICILPLDADIKPLKTIMPFYVDLKVKRPENIDKHAVKIAKVNWLEKQQRALEPFMAADLFDEWFQRLGLPLGKKIVPLAQNWPFDREFILEWLGFETFHQLFHPHYRDSMSAAIFCNDCAAFKNEKVPFCKVNLEYLSHIVEVKNLKSHDALQDCITTAETYRRLILKAV